MLTEVISDQTEFTAMQGCGEPVWDAAKKVWLYANGAYCRPGNGYHGDCYYKPEPNPVNAKLSFVRIKKRELIAEYNHVYSDVNQKVENAATYGNLPIPSGWEESLETTAKEIQALEAQEEELTAQLPKNQPANVALMNQLTEQRHREVSDARIKLGKLPTFPQYCDPEQPNFSDGMPGNPFVS
jgi:hypothetical protein